MDRGGSPGLAVTSADGVVDVVLRRGDDNLLTIDMCRVLTDRLLTPDAGDHVLRIRADGPVFCLGRERRAETPDELRVEARSLVALNEALSSSPMVTVAQVHGDAAGFGVGLAALCDITIAAPSAGFRFPEVEIDLAPVVVLSWLPDLIGHKEAFRLTASGARVDARRAADLGLVTTVTDTDDSLDAVVTDEIAALRKRMPRVHSEVKGFLRATDDLSRAQAYELALDRLVLGSMARRR